MGRGHSQQGSRNRKMRQNAAWRDSKSLPRWPQFKTAPPAGGRTDGAGAAPAPDRGHRPGGAWRYTGGILQPVPFCPNSSQLIIHAITIRAVFKARILVSDFYTLHLCMFCPSSTAPVSEWTSLRCAKNPCNQKQLA